jgi:hypothetical protein
MSASTNIDLEKGIRPRIFPDGYASISAYIATDPELAIFRRFDRLSARNLLYLQGELQHLEYRLSQFDEETVRSTNVCTQGLEAVLPERCWERLVGTGGERLVIVKSIRSIVREYRKHLPRISNNSANEQHSTSRRGLDPLLPGFKSSAAADSCTACDYLLVQPFRR